MPGKLGLACVGATGLIVAWALASRSQKSPGQEWDQVLVRPCRELGHRRDLREICAVQGPNSLCSIWRALVRWVQSRGPCRCVVLE